MKKLLIFIITMLVFVTSVMFILGKWHIEFQNANEPRIDRASFVTDCTVAAMHSKDISLAEANRYCLCVLDGGVERYGTEKFAEMVNRLGRIDNASGELQLLINECSGKGEEA